MFFSFKTKPEDFFVKEELNFQLDWIWDFFYVFFEKRLLNTMDIINSLCNEFNLKRNDIWITWLKDKEWITQQRFSISKKYLKCCWWQQNFLSFLKENVKIIGSWWHNQPLSVWQNKWNRFIIRLRKRTPIPEDLKIKLEKNIKNSQKSPFPNIYWFQRFWKWNKNFKKVLRLLTWEDIWKNNYEVKFTLQTFWSLWFNEYTMRRRENKQTLLEWDIMVNWWNAFWTQVAIYSNQKLSHFDYRKEKELIKWKTFREAKTYLRDSDYIVWNRFPTWPVLWSEQLVCKQWTPWRDCDDNILKESLFLDTGHKLLKNYKIYWYRRPLWITPKNLQRSWEDWDLILDFSLPTWCYATSYLTFLLNEIDPKWCESNNLKIPRIKSL